MMEAQRERRTPLRCATHKHRQEHWPVLGGARVTLMLQRARRRHDRHRKRASRGSQLGVAAANCGSSRFATPGHDSPKASRCPTNSARRNVGNVGGRSRGSRCTILLEAASKPALPCAQPAQPLPRTRAAMPDPPPPRAPPRETPSPTVWRGSSPLDALPCLSPFFAPLTLPLVRTLAGAAPAHSDESNSTARLRAPGRAHRRADARPVQALGLLAPLSINKPSASSGWTARCCTAR